MCCKKHGMGDDTPTPPDENTQDISSDVTHAKNENSQQKHFPNIKLQHKLINRTDIHDKATKDANLDTENEYDVGPELQAILARLVSDYRAIFAIEDELHHADGWSFHSCSIPHCHCNSYQDGSHINRYL